jgi:hypothetical protein
LGLEGARHALEALSQQKGKILIFKRRAESGRADPAEKEKAVSRAVNF